MHEPLELVRVRAAVRQLRLSLPLPSLAQSALLAMADETAASETKAVAPIQIPPGTVRLRSSDGHLVPVDRLTLAAASSVFRDMFEVVFTDEEAAEDCPVAETLEELEILVKGLEGNANRSEADWLTLYKFMDKYDMEPLRILLRLMAR